MLLSRYLEGMLNGCDDQSVENDLLHDDLYINLHIFAVTILKRIGERD